MLDIKWIRENQEAFVKGLADRGFDDPQGTLTQILKLDEQRRETIQNLERLQARQKVLSKKIGKAGIAGMGRAGAAMAGHVPDQSVLDEATNLKMMIQDSEAEKRLIVDEVRKKFSEVPNIPAADVPVGSDEKSNVILREVGKKPKYDFTPKQHFELGQALGLMDFETAAKLSGKRFVVLKGQLARLERALAQFMLDLHTSTYKNEEGKELGGYTEVNPPLLVRDDTMFGTAQLPKFREEQFLGASEGSRAELFRKAMKHATESDRDAICSDRKSLDQVVEEILERAPSKEDYWLIPTAEVPLTNLVRENITEENKLPIRVTAWTPCFRAEAGAAGKDTRGMIRQHQFSKVELVSITTPEQSAREHERMTASAEEVLKRLEIPYRVVTLSTGDMGFAAQKTYDIEVWLPGQGEYREISSCSNCGDFQARRMDARYRTSDSKKREYVHTLNGSGLAVGRALIAILENYQRANGTIEIPRVLRRYMGGRKIIRKAKPTSKSWQAL